MKGIGWIQNDEDVDSVLNQRFTKGRTTSTTSDTNHHEVPAAEQIEVADEMGAREAKQQPTSITSTSKDPSVPATGASRTPAIGLLRPDLSTTGIATTTPSISNNPFFSGAAMVGGPLTHDGLASSSSRRGGGRGSDARNWRQGGNSSSSSGRRQQERPEKRGDRTYAYRKKG